MEGQFLPSLRQLRTFAAVARFDSISRASAQLRLSQSAVTQAIATLEANLDVPLFVRRSKGTYLTEYGEILKKRTIRFFETIESAIRELGDETDPVQRISTASASYRITKSQVRALIAIHLIGLVHPGGSPTWGLANLGPPVGAVARSPTATGVISRHRTGCNHKRKWREIRRTCSPGDARA